MPSVFDSVIDLVGRSDTMDRFAQAIGTDSDSAERAVGVATPALLGGLADRAAEPGGARRVIDMMDVADIGPDNGVDSAFGSPELGRGLVDNILGPDRGGLVGSLASRAGIGSGVMGRLLPMLAPLVMGVLARRRAADGLSESGLANLLTGEKENLERGGLLGAVTSNGGTRRAAAAVGATGAAAAGAGTAVAGRIGRPDSDVPRPRKRGFGWLWWLLGALLLLAVAAWALSQCGGTDVVDDATDVAAGAVDDAADAAGDAVDDAADAAGDAADGAADAADDALDGAGDAMEDAADAAGDAADDAADTVTGALDLQPDIDGAIDDLGLAGVSAAVGDDGTVVLTGSVDTDGERQAAEDAVAGIEGVTAVDNQIEVAEAAADGESADGEAAEGESADGEGADSGSTINELLDLEPITFAVNSSELTAEGTAVLDEAAAFLDANPDVAVEIGGHTDSDGDEAANLALSQDRADSVKAYLESQGIDGDRMTTQGYGEAEPKVENDTPENKAINRRIEFTIQ